jgi:hypothetical protein
MIELSKRRLVETEVELGMLEGSKRNEPITMGEKLEDG